MPRPARKQRRSQTQDARSTSNCMLTKATPSTSPGAKESLNEIEAIRQAQTGDPAAFETLYRLHRPRVFAVCLRMVRDPAEAEDLTQEAFLLLLRKIQTFRGESAFSTWLHRLAVNLVLMRFRKKTPPIVSIEMIFHPTDESSAPSTLEPATPDHGLAFSIDRINIERFVDL